LLSKAIYVSEQVCIWWCRTDAYYAAKLTFSHDFPIQVWGAYYTSVRIIFKFLWYMETLNKCIKCYVKVPSHLRNLQKNDMAATFFESPYTSKYGVHRLKLYSSESLLQYLACDKIFLSVHCYS